jgi:hypothetical protein
MTDGEKLLLRRKWKYADEFKTFGNVMGKMEGFGELDLRTDGLLILRDNLGQFEYSLVDRSLEISSSANSKNVLRLRIGELTTDKLIMTISGKRGDEVDDKFNKEIVELTYRPIDERAQ